MLLVLVLNVCNISLCNLSSARGTPLLLGHLVDNITAKLIFLCLSHHKPFTIEALEVIAVEAIIHTAEVWALRKFQMRVIVFLVFLNKVFEADGASASQCVIILG